MPKKPQNNDSEKSSDNNSSDSSRSDIRDGIDDLELEPISSQIPGEKSADSIPPKQAPAEEPELTDDQVDDISLDDISLKNDDSGSPNANSKVESINQPKSAGRMYPSGKEVDLTTKSEEKPAAAEPESDKKKLHIAAAQTDEPTLEDDSEEFILVDEPLPDAACEEAPPLVGEPIADHDQTEAPKQEDPSEYLIQDANEIEDVTIGIKQRDDHSSKKNSNTSLVEKISIGLFILLLIVGLVIYIPQMIPEGQLTKDIVDVAETPIQLEDITIETLDARWTETLHITSRVRRNVEWTPEVELAISGSGSGAFRIIFLNQDARQRGDTIDIAYADGKFLPSMQSSEKIYCTHGFTSELELKDLRARGDSWWTVRMLKGQDIKAPSSEFETIIEMKIPFEIVLSEG